MHCGAVFCFVLLCYAMLYCILSHALKNTANQRPGLPLHILRYAAGNTQRVVFHSSFPLLLARNSLLGSIRGLLKSKFRNSSTPANHYEHFRSCPEISEDFRTLPRISENFKKSLKHLNITFEPFPKFSENFWRFPNTSEDFLRFSEDFKNHKNIWKTLLNCFRSFPKVS